MPYSDYENLKRWRERRRVWIESLKTSCVVCGESEPACLDWHHLDTETKVVSISRMKSSSTYSQQRVLEELEKCVLLCANCHRKIHAGVIQELECHADNVEVRGANPLTRTQNVSGKGISSLPEYVCGTRRTYRKGCKCSLCKEANAAETRKYR